MMRCPDCSAPADASPFVEHEAGCPALAELRAALAADTQWFLDHPDETVRWRYGTALEAAGALNDSLPPGAVIVVKLTWHHVGIQSEGIVMHSQHANA